MVEKILDYLKNTFNRVVILAILKKLSATSLVGIFITMSSLIFYSIGYSFLYGYYFSGMNPASASLIQLLIINVPFSFYSVIITSIMFIGIVSFFIILLWNMTIAFKHLFKKNYHTLSFIRILIMLVSFCTFHYALTAFFVGGFLVSSIQLIEFLDVWIGPFVIAALFYLIFQIKNGPISSFSGMIFGFLSFVGTTAFLVIEPSKQALIALLEIFLMGFLFSFFEHWLKFFWYRFFVALSFSVILMLIIFHYCPLPFKYGWIGWLVFTICVIALSIIASFVSKKWMKPKSDPEVLSEEEMEQNRISNKAAMKRLRSITLATLFTIAVLTFTGTSIPIIAGTTGVLFRLATPYTHHQSIYYEKIGDSNSKDKGNAQPQLENAELIAQKDDMYYISDSNSQLIMIKTDKIQIQSSLK